MDRLACHDVRDWREAAAVVVLVLGVHLALIALWETRSSMAPEMVRDMEVELAPVAPEQARHEVQPDTPPPIQQTRQETPEHVTEQPVVQQEAAPHEPVPVAPPSVVAPAPSVQTPVQAEAAQPDTDPDYQAAFLNNQVIYPLIAKRMGMEGSAIINIEVLASGVSGKVELQQSSGHFLLDESALRSAQNWRFIPAQHGGQPVTKWMKIAVRFSLKDNKP